MSENVLKMMNALFEELNSLDINELEEEINALKQELQDIIEKIELNEKVLERKNREISESKELQVKPVVVMRRETKQEYERIPEKMSLKEKISWGILFGVIVLLGIFAIISLVSK